MTTDQAKTEEPYVIIAVPSGTMVHADFMMDLLQAVLVSSAEYGMNVGVDNFKGSILPISRTELVKNALQRGATHVCFIDSDMRFPAEVIPRLLSHEKPVVAANCVTKRIPSTPTARLKHPDVLGGVPLFKVWSDDQPQLEEVWRVGTGVMMIDLKVFDQIPEPWFPITWDAEHKRYWGEDWSFCQALEQLEIPIYVDVPLSFAIKHQGKFDYSMNEVIADENA